MASGRAQGGGKMWGMGCVRAVPMHGGTSGQAETACKRGCAAQQGQGVGGHPGGRNCAEHRHRRPCAWLQRDHGPPGGQHAPQHAQHPPPATNYEAVPRAAGQGRTSRTASPADAARPRWRRYTGRLSRRSGPAHGAWAVQQGASASISSRSWGCTSAPSCGHARQAQAARIVENLHCHSPSRGAKSLLVCAKRPGGRVENGPSQKKS